MAEKDDLPFIMSGEELIKSTSNRSIIPCTLSMDIALGGGIPLGATVLIGGKEKSGKTTYSLSVAANAQIMYGSKVFFFPAEGRLTEKVMRQIPGLKLGSDDFNIVKPPAIIGKTGEHKGKVIGFQKKGSEWWFEQIGRTIQENPRSVIIVDSIANLMSDKQISEGLGYEDRGKSKAIETGFCKKYGECIIDNQVTLILLTQVMANTSGYGGMTMKVGNQIKFQSDVIVFFKAATKWPEQEGKILGHDILVDIKEAPNAAPYTECSVPIRYGFGVDTIKDIIDHASNFGIIHVGGSWYTLPFLMNEDGDVIPTAEKVPDGYKEVKVQGLSSVREFLLKNKKICLELDNRIRKMVFGNRFVPMDKIYEAKAAIDI